jgi:tRNA wybutosine-synthesizing protein 2
MKAVRIRAEDAETVRRQLLLEGALDKTRKLIKKNVFVEIPVNESFSIESHLIDQEKPEFYIPKKTLSSILEIPEQEKRLLPKGWQILGDIIIISLREELEKRKNDIGRALLSLYPGCRTVLLDRGISGKTRQPSREIIAGAETETVHKENGCLFKIDAMHLMYSRGNLTEKKRMSMLGGGEVVVDMFAGIGYFSIPMAVHSRPKKIFAIEINPIAFDYLKKNIILNCVEDIIEPIAGDCALVTPRCIADRVIMGYLDSNSYLEQGIRALLPCGIIHYHEAVPEAIENRPVERLIEAAGRMGRNIKILDACRIKKYSPGVWHVVVDVMVA